MSLLDEIRADLTNETAGVSNTLRKARVLAHELQSPELAEWVNFETAGYPNDDLVPSYRHFVLPIFGNFHGVFQSRMTGVVLPTNNLPAPDGKVFNELAVREGMGVVEAILASNNEVFHVQLPAEFTLMLRDHVRVTGGMVLHETYRQVPRHIFAGILDNVKNRLLDFVLDLQGKGVTPEGISSGTDSPDLVRNAININIHGNNNVVAAGENVHQEFKPIHKGDITSLIEHLRDYNVAEEDLGELKEAVASEPNMTGDGFGPKVMAWIGKMTTKAISGAWQAGIPDATAMLVKDLQAFYGG